MFAEQLIGGSKMATGRRKWLPAPFLRPALAYRGRENDCAGHFGHRVAILELPISCFRNIAMRRSVSETLTDNRNVMFCPLKYRNVIALAI